MAIAKVTTFAPGTKIADIGTGGGFLGIPLAILFPESKFTLIDSIGKKVRVAESVAESIGLKNVVCRHERAEEEKEKFHFVVSRGVMPLPDLCKICNKLINKKEQFNAYPNGLICLKGGDLSGETQNYRNVAEIVNISNYFSEEFFNDKKVVYVQI
jgi:16S rRNA (guanine527-N7)-methyltransferase